MSHNFTFESLSASKFEEIVLRGRVPFAINELSEKALHLYLFRTLELLDKNLEVYNAILDAIKLRIIDLEESKNEDGVLVNTKTMDAVCKTYNISCHDIDIQINKAVSQVFHPFYLSYKATEIEGNDEYVNLKIEQCFLTKEQEKELENDDFDYESNVERIAYLDVKIALPVVSCVRQIKAEYTQNLENGTLLEQDFIIRNILPYIKQEDKTPFSYDGLCEKFNGNFYEFYKFITIFVCIINGSYDKKK